MYAKKVEVELENGTKFKSNMEFFDSANELYDVSIAREILHDDDDKLTEEPDLGWTGVSSVEEAVQLLKDGWMDRIPEVKAKIGETTKTLPSSRRAFRNGPVGFAPVVPLAIMGVPNSMVADDRKPVKGKVIEVCYDFGATSDISRESLLWAGMEVLSVLVRLEREGYRVRLTTAHWQSSKHYGDAAVVRIKSENQPFDLKRIMFPMMNPAYFRVIHFGWYCRCPSAKHIPSYGASLYRFSQEDEDRIVRASLGDRAVYISAGRMIEDRKNYQDYLKRQLGLVGVKAENLF